MLISKLGISWPFAQMKHLGNLGMGWFFVFRRECTSMNHRLVWCENHQDFPDYSHLQLLYVGLLVEVLTYLALAVQPGNSEWCSFMWHRVEKNSSSQRDIQIYSRVYHLDRKGIRIETRWVSFNIAVTSKNKYWGSLIGWRLGFSSLCPQLVLGCPVLGIYWQPLIDHYVCGSLMLWGKVEDYMLFLMVQYTQHICHSSNS